MQGFITLTPQLLGEEITPLHNLALRLPATGKEPLYQLQEAAAAQLPGWPAGNQRWFKGHPPEWLSHEPLWAQEIPNEAQLGMVLHLAGGGKKSTAETDEGKACLVEQSRLQDRKQPPR